MQTLSGPVAVWCWQSRLPTARSGDLTDDEEIFQWYIVQDPDFLIEHTDELIFYDTELDLYIWGITHFGTSWDYVPTSDIH